MGNPPVASRPSNYIFVQPQGMSELMRRYGSGQVGIIFPVQALPWPCFYKPVILLLTQFEQSDSVKMDMEDRTAVPTGRVRGVKGRCRSQ
ncbi:hypothetical protein MKZ38_008348 [Zalerion maritima]|uniref:Uncharacterized protein n=1 Tax=Zalerion maritima TaxID=339359 RepID=A0AAD5WTC9_9PEZI|nr:hypothetical protein MKZ38_008348 [Zalerion maritima]